MASEQTKRDYIFTSDRRLLLSFIDEMYSTMREMRIYSQEVEIKLEGGHSIKTTLSWEPNKKWYQFWR